MWLFSRKHSLKIPFAWCLVCRPCPMMRHCTHSNIFYVPRAWVYFVLESEYISIYITQIKLVFKQEFIGGHNCKAGYVYRISKTKWHTLFYVLGLKCRTIYLQGTSPFDSVGKNCIIQMLQFQNEKVDYMQPYVSEKYTGLYMYRSQHEYVHVQTCVFLTKASRCSLGVGI